jgi:NAD+ kinase
LKKLAHKIERVGLIVNPDKAMCRSVVKTAARLIANGGREALTDEPSARMANLKTGVVRDAAALARESDLLLVFGGDGTMLRVAREVAGVDTPILGINIGGLGFLTAVPSSQLQAALKMVWAGEFELESRHLICAMGMAHGVNINQTALNDFVIGRIAASRMIELEVSVDGYVLTCYRCDGLIVSSPTGSTAYSLSAGGAVVCPNAEVLTITPICPHTLSNRSVIVSLNSRVQVKAISHRLEMTLTADGQVQTSLCAGDEITIGRSSRAVSLMHLAGSSFFATLRQKLNWSGSSLHV